MRRRFPLGFCCVSLFLLMTAALVVLSPPPPRGQAQPETPGPPQHPLATYPKAAEVNFEPNFGQTDPRVRYISHGAGSPMFLMPDGLVARLTQPSSDVDHVVEMKIIGANPQAESEELNPQPGLSNYFIGNDPDRWQRGIRRFGSVKFKGVYPGIDLLYRGSTEPLSGGAQALEYDFVVNPGADPARIRLQFTGVEDVRLSDEGDLTLQTVVGDLRQRRPVVYQQMAEVRRPVDGRFDLSPDGQVGFSVGAYDTKLPLVIDPKVEYSTYLGGSGDDQSFGIKVGPDGSVYVTGWTESVDFPDVTAKGGGGNRDVFLARIAEFSPGLITYSVTLGGFMVEQGQSLAVDSDGNAYIVGWTESPNFPTTDGSGVTGGRDSFTAAFDTAGNLVFARRFGGSGADEGWAIDVTEVENLQIESKGDPGRQRIVVTGSRIASNDAPTTPVSAPQPEYGGGDSDGYIEALLLDTTTSPTFTVKNQAASHLGGNRADAVDSIGLGNLTINTGSGEENYNFFVASTTNSTSGILVNGCDPCSNFAGGTDVHFTALRLDPTFGDTFGGADPVGMYLPSGSGNESEVRFKIAENTSPIPRDRVIFSYNSFSNNVPTDENAAMPNNPGEQSPVLTILEPDSETGKPVFVGTTYAGGSQFDQAADMALDPNGAPAVVGLTFSQLPTTPNAIFRNRNGVFGGWLALYSSDLSTITYQTYMWGNANSNVTAIDFDPFGQFYIAGINGTGALTTPNAFQTNFGGGPWDVTIGGFTRPFLFDNGVGNAASFDPGISHQQISVGVGGNIGPNEPIGLTLDQAGRVLDGLGDTGVNINGQPAFLTFVSRFQDNFIPATDAIQIFLRPKGAETQTAAIQIVVAGDPSNIVEVPVLAANPGLFALDGSGQGQGAILNPDFTTNGPANPAPSNGFIIVYGTGGGITDPLCPDGGFGPFAEPLPRLELPVQVFVDGDEVNQNYAGSAPGLVCGVNQFNVIPTNSPSGPAVPIQVCVNEVCSNIVTAAFE